MILQPVMWRPQALTSATNEITLNMTYQLMQKISKLLGPLLLDGRHMSGGLLEKSSKLCQKHCSCLVQQRCGKARQWKHLAEHGQTSSQDNLGIHQHTNKATRSLRAYAAGKTGP